MSKIADNAFENCPAAADNTAFDICGKILVRYSGSHRIAIIPSFVNKIGVNAFRNCTALKTVFIPKRVTEIQDDAFDSCEALTRINIPEGVTRIGNRTFFKPRDDWKLWKKVR